MHWEAVHQRNWVFRILLENWLWRSKLRLREFCYCYAFVIFVGIVIHIFHTLFSYITMQPTLCNVGGLPVNTRDMMPGSRSDNGCTETQNWSEEELRDWAEGVCEFSCTKFGVTLYPDLSCTEPYNTTNLACPNPFFDVPTLVEPAACQANNSLPQSIELINSDTLEEVGFVPDDSY